MKIDFDQFKKIAQDEKERVLLKEYVEYVKLIKEAEVAGVQQDAKDSPQNKAQIYDFLKYFLGTFVLGAAATISTWIVKVYELKIQQRKEEMASVSPHIASYMRLLKEDGNKFDRAYYMTEFLCGAITEKNLNNGLKVVRDSCLNRMKAETLKVKMTYTNIVKEANDLNAQLDSLDAKKDTTKIKILEQKLNEVNKEKIALVKEVVDKFDAPPIPVPVTVERSIHVIYDDEKYTAEGYQSLITDNITVAVNKINRTKGEVEFEVYDREKSVNSFVLKIGGNNRVKVNESYFMEINLNEVKRATLKIAAFYSVKIEKKQ